MLFPRFINSQNVSLNGIPENYAPAYPADSVVQTLTPFQVPKKSALKVFYAPAFKANLGTSENGATLKVKVDNNPISNALGLFSVTLDGENVSTTSAYGNLHFGKNGNSLVNGNKIELSNLPVTGAVFFNIIEKQDINVFNNSFGLAITIINRNTFTLEKITGAGAVSLVNSLSITTIQNADVLSVEITETAIIIKRNTTVLYTHNLQYKLRLLNEEGTAVDANAGTLTLADGSAYANTFVSADTELKYTVGDDLDTFNVEIESELGRKILQKVIVVDTPSTPMLPVAFNSNAVNLRGEDSPVSFWNQYKTYFLIGGAFLGLSLLGAFLINRFSK